MRSLIKNKRGALTDVFLWVIVSFIIGMFTVLIYFAGTRTYTALLDKAPELQKALGNDGNATDIIQHSFGQVVNAYQSLKWISFMLILGFALTILVTSFFVKTHPIALVPYMIIYVLAIIISVPMANTYEEVYRNPLLAESFSGFWGQTWIFLNLPIWITVIGAFAGVLLFVNAVRS
jgi:uncharacterized membrane protein YagU involved in acid resistance